MVQFLIIKCDDKTATCCSCPQHERDSVYGQPRVLCYCSREEIKKATRDTNTSTSEKCVTVFQIDGKANLINMLRIISFVPNVPGSCAFIERIFSLMTNKWSDSRNRCSTVNCDLSCKDFFSGCTKDKKQLESVKNSQNIHGKVDLVSRDMPLFYFSFNLFTLSSFQLIYSLSK